MPTVCVDRDRGAAASARNIPTDLLLGLIAFYQRCVSPLLGPHCRFHPTCSNYAAQAIARHGVLLGTARAIARIVRCQPLCEGGYDPVR